MDKEASPSQTRMSDYFPRKEPSGEHLPHRALNVANKTQNSLLTNPTQFASDENQSVVTDQANTERLSEKNL